MHPRVGEIWNNRKRTQSAICTLGELLTIYKSIAFGNKAVSDAVFPTRSRLRTIICGCHVNDRDLQVEGKASGVEWRNVWEERGLESTHSQQWNRYTVDP